MTDLYADYKAAMREYKLAQRRAERAAQRAAEAAEALAARKAEYHATLERLFPKVNA